ncbi:aldolase/citrate lyase family protein [Sphingomonas pokkalii]|uniref:Aldolase n=1 Tax=Sphingomonas pokkalii TaxID=2175090 RepID=A0A2U0SFL9_9SPHN|nr:aldolase/citrate lyase family protein [Sphingomonas pokkalii]PVX30158.1 aldolase [Sphingomonas pokkalii]
MNILEKRMLAILREGRANFGFNAVKAEFEAEGTRVDEFLRLLEIARRADLKVGLKIGGCEAIRDLIEGRQFGIDYVIAPMVETPYALTKYVAAKNKVFDADERAEVGFLFNVETISTYHQVDAMGEIAREAGVGMVLGRVDFAGSLGHTRDFVNTDEMLGYARKVAEVAKSANVDLVIGGGVSPDSIAQLRSVREIRLDRFETRKVIFDAAVLDGEQAARGMELAIEFELLWLQNKRNYYKSIAAEDEARITMMEKRQAASMAAAA